MRTAARAKIEEDIAALTKEVKELKRSRGAGHPDPETLGDFVAAALGYDRVREMLDRAPGLTWKDMIEAVGALVVAPAAHELRAAAVAAFEAAVQDDLSIFVRACQSLREALLALLAVRAKKWRSRYVAGDFYPSRWQSNLDPVEQARLRVSKLNRWQLLLWAGKALACAQDDLWLWWLWQAGQREFREAQHHSGQKTAQDEEMWQREVLEHMLPEEEAAIVDGWPVPPDEHWPEGNTKGGIAGCGYRGDGGVRCHLPAGLVGSDGRAAGIGHQGEVPAGAIGRAGATGGDPAVPGDAAAGAGGVDCL